MIDYLLGAILNNDIASWIFVDVVQFLTTRWHDTQINLSYWSLLIKSEIERHYVLIDFNLGGVKTWQSYSGGSPAQLQIVMCEVIQ